MQISSITLAVFILENTDHAELDAHALAEKICEKFTLTKKSEYKLNADDVRALRQMTGDSLQVCKLALVKAEGDMEKASQIVRDYGRMSSPTN